MTTNITVKPIYGYGWMRGSSEEIVPDSFRIEVWRRDDRDEFPSSIFGKVIESRHKYAECWVLLLLRTKSPDDPHFNVYVYEQEPPFAHAGDLNPTACPSGITGFATLASTNG